jgi:hypothetical protein
MNNSKLLPTSLSAYTRAAGAIHESPKGKKCFAPD